MIRALAVRQHGVVARAQLVEAGVSPRSVDYRLKKGRLERLHRAVYRVGPLPARWEKEMAAVLTCGGTAVLSHRSAAVLWQLLPQPASERPVEVSIERGYRRPGSGLCVHRVAKFRADEVLRLEGLPVTAPARTILDLAGSSEARELEQAVAQAERLGLSTRAQVTTLLARHPRRAGARLLRALLAPDAQVAFTRSEAESRFLALVRKAQLPAPATNVVVRGYEVDFLWRAAGLVVEIDGYAFHSSSGAFERDRRRDGVLTAAGFRVLRVTWRQLSREPEALLVRLAQALVHDERI